MEGGRVWLGCVVLLRVATCRQAGVPTLCAASAPALPQREEGNRLAESRVWSPVKTKRQDAAAMVAATAAAGDEEEEAGGGGGGGHGAGSVPAAVTSRSSAPSGLSQVSTPVQAVQRRQRQQQRKQALSGAELEAYDQASASLGSAQRQEAQASRGGPVRVRHAGAAGRQAELAAA